MPLSELHAARNPLELNGWYQDILAQLPLLYGQAGRILCRLAVFAEELRPWSANRAENYSIKGLAARELGVSSELKLVG